MIISSTYYAEAWKGKNVREVPEGEEEQQVVVQTLEINAIRPTRKSEGCQAP